MVTLAGQSLLRHIENKDIDAVSGVVQNGMINLDERDEDGQTFLMIASQLGDVEIVRQLLQSVDVNAVDNDNWSALLNAAKHGHHEVVSVLLDAGANVEHKDIGNWTALMWASYKGRTEVVNELLNNGANPNVKGEHAMSCLTWATGRGHTEVVKLLIRHGAQVNTADKYGTTPLIWAARKGHMPIVDILLKEGANVNNSGMNSWTALIVAAKGGYTEVVKMLLAYNPDVNVKDKDCHTALALAAKDGHLEILNLLLQKEAYVNIPDREGDTILIHAVKGGHQDVVRALLKKYADVDVQGVDNKTALYWSVEKGHPNITKMLLDFNANGEMSTKDGDTPLLKAVRCRHADIVQMLIEKGAKINAHDKKEDTALHIAVRGRNKRITELLLRNPKDGRLLYKPNRSGETPYQIDAQHDRSILTQVFGARNLNADENIKGYELYSSTLADVLSEPSLHTPITVGLYAKWGSGKSFLIDKLTKEMKAFTKHNAETQLEFTGIQFAVSFILCLIVGLALGLSVRWEVGLGVGLGLLFMAYCFYGFLWYGTFKMGWDWSDDVGSYLARKFQFLQLLLQVIFCNEPKHPVRDTAAVKFLFTDNARLASVVGEKSITAMIGTLCDALEDEFGLFSTRLYRVFKPQKAAEHGKFKTLCCVPYFVIVIFIVLCIAAAATLMAVYGIHSITEKKYTAVDSVLIAIAVVLGVAILANVYTWSQMIYNIALSPRRRVYRIGENLGSLKMEGFMQTLKKEVQLMGHMTRCMDAFLASHTRLVVFVDGLDSCEQEKLLQVLDTVHMLFTDTLSPFVTVLAVDPHVIIKGIEQNLHGLFRDTSISGHDYLRNIVHLPFYLQSQALPKPRYARTSESTPGQGSNLTRDGTSASYMSLPDTGRGKGKKKASATPSTTAFASSSMMHHSSQQDLTKQLGKNSYFSDVNPRNMKRLMNIIAVTGRLMRANSIEFNWHKLAAWANITEQWPYILSWMILEIEDNENVEDPAALKSIYDLVSPKLPSSKEADPLVEIDRNARKLEIFLSSHMPKLTVADVRTFMPCTINIDPYLRKLIREYQHSVEAGTVDYNNLYGGPGDLMGWPTNSQATITVGRPRSRHHSSPRATPTRPISSRASMLTPSGFPPMLIPPQMMSNPVLAQMGAMNAYMQGMMQSQGGYPGGGGAGGSLGGNQTPVPPMGTAPRVQIKGGLTQEKLSSLPVEYICNLLQRLEGLNQNKLPNYQSSVIENNISGMVLLNCELHELKPVMGMTFGDWELFKAMVMTLRDREVSGFAASMKQFDMQGSETEGFQSPNIHFTQNVNNLDPTLEVPSPHYAAGSSSARRDETQLAPEKTAMKRGSMNRDTIAPLQAPKVKESRSKTSLRERGGKYEDVVDYSNLPKGMSRKDSFIQEVMMEGALLKGVIAATGVQTDSEDEGEGSPSPVPEPRKLSRREKQEVRDKQKRAQWEAKQMEAEREKSQERDKSVCITEEEEDSDAEEMERLSRKSSISNLSCSSYGVRRSLPATTMYVNEVRTPPKSAPKSNASSRESLYYSPIKQTSVNDDDSVGENVPLVHSAKQSKSSLKLDLSKKTTKSKESLSEEKSSGSTPTTCKMGLDLGGSQSGVTSLASSTQDIPSFADQEQDFIQLRKLTQSADVSAPSAFKPVTPGSSRASSRASSLALSGSQRPISRADSQEAIRLHINESFEAKSPAHSSRPQTPRQDDDIGDELNHVFVDSQGRTTRNIEERQRLL